MKKTRKIIEIDEQKCTGCGQCILACAEGALKLLNGKAKLVGEIYCDGIGACIGTCPEGALTIAEREAEAFDEQAVWELLRTQKSNTPPEKIETLPCGCPSSEMMSLRHSVTKSPKSSSHEDVPSSLGHWPVKLQLLGPHAPFLKGSDLILLADCAAAAYPALHQDLFQGRTVAMGCPKLDDLDAHIDRLTEIIREASPRSLTVVHMEVPCCRAFVQAARQAIERSGVEIPLEVVIISRTGEVLNRQSIDDPSPECGHMHIR
jgi:NAD-dependent dihydropyrimidine dehydrogenase PreA subunit